jgi:hypothetical protein
MGQLTALVGALVFVCTIESVCAEPLRLGRPATPADVARRDTAILPDGRNLPVGSGTAAEGRRVYARHCRYCHGAIGKSEFRNSREGRGVGAFWPYATTLWDYIRRAMPSDAPRSISDNDVYAVTAYLLANNGIIAADAKLDRISVPLVRMPNRKAFVRPE